jgi:hypothetical protein
LLSHFIVRLMRKSKYYSKDSNQICLTNAQISKTNGLMKYLWKRESGEKACGGEIGRMSLAALQYCLISIRTPDVPKYHIANFNCH